MYIINKNTYFIVKKERKIEITEKENFFQFEEHFNKFLTENCNYYGSSYEGRKESSKYLLQLRSKVPIILNERKNIVLFSISSDRNRDNIWFVYNNILTYKKIKEYVEVTFKNNEKVVFLISYNIFKNQMNKCSRLISIFLLRE